MVKKSNKRLKLDTAKLKQEIKTELKTKLNEHLRDISNNNKEITPIESWNNIEEVIRNCATEKLGFYKRKSKKTMNDNRNYGTNETKTLR